MEVVGNRWSFLTVGRFIFKPFSETEEQELRPCLNESESDL